MVICQGRLDAVVPLENASMPDRVVIQWDKDDCADMGLVKVDLLGLGMMAVLQDALTMVNGTRDSGSGLGVRNSRTLKFELDPESRSRPRASLVDLAHLPQTIPRSTRCCRRPTRSGSSRSNRGRRWRRLPRLRPQCFYDIVVEVAIIRPGPIVGQMVHPVSQTAAGHEPVEYPHPSLEPILKRTLGVPLFQEQLLRMAMVAAGFSGGEAEELRRAFGFKRSEKRMQQIEGKLRAAWRVRASPATPAEAIIALDHVVRALRLSGIARRQLCAAGLRERLPEGALSGGVLHGDPQQPADGVLSPGHAGQGCAAPRRPLSRRSTCRYRTGSAASSRMAGCGWG